MRATYWIPRRRARSRNARGGRPCGRARSDGSAGAMSCRPNAVRDGSVLVAFRSTARDSTELIDAVDDLSRQVRDRIGEPLKSIRASEPLHAVTTSSLPALRKYAEAELIGRRNNDYVTMAARLEE